MSKRTFPDKSRLLFKTNGSIKRLLNIQTLYRDGAFFEYKFTFEGFPKQSEWFYAKNAVLDSTKGVRRFRTRESHHGKIEVGYHVDGNTFYKFVGGVGNLKVTRLPQLEKMNKPVKVLTIAGFSIDFLRLMDKPLSSDDEVVPLNDYKMSQPITCDIYLSRARVKAARYGLVPRKGFRNSQLRYFEDSKNNIGLHLHFYEADIFNPIIMIPKNSILAKIQSKYLYCFYRFTSKK